MGMGARRIDRHDGHRGAIVESLSRQTADEGALPGAGRSGYPDPPGAVGIFAHAGQRFRHGSIGDTRKRPPERAPIEPFRRFTRRGCHADLRNLHRRQGTRDLGNHIVKPHFGGEDRHHARIDQRCPIVRRNGAADKHGNVAGIECPKLPHRFGDQFVVAPGKQGQADRIDVLVDGDPRDKARVLRSPV